jgi:3-hydroxyacyl-[acyl-carrier-protein] dehydratase
VAELDIRQIMEILPHRYPMLLVDRILELEPGSRARGFKNVTANEPMFTGHFPGNPVLPGVYIIEAMAQLGGAVVLEPGEFSRRVPYLAGVDKCKFRRPVVPGDRLMMEVVCSAELMFSIATDPRSFNLDAPVLHA